MTETESVLTSKELAESVLQDNSTDYSNSPDTHQQRRRWRIPKPGMGIWLDLQDRLPLYGKDWTDAWDYRVIPSVIETYFNNLLPALAFAQDMFDRTDNAYGVNEVLLSSAMAGIVFGVMSGQPLCIVGVTGPVSIFNYTVYDIIKPLNTDYFGFMFWVCIWSMIFHFIMAITNLVGLLQYVTTFPCDIFGFFINVVYIQKGIQILILQFNNDNAPDADTNASGFASIVVALLMLIFGLIFKQFTRTPLLNHTIRTFISDYSTALSVLFWSAFTHFGGRLNDIHFEKLPITKSFFPTSQTMRDPTTWLAYHSIPARDVFIALPFGIILTILFYFDHNVSSLMAQRYQYKLTKPSSFHYDFLLLGVTTGIAGVLGIPAPNGLIPQAPLHTESLLVHDVDGSVIKCVEQRFTNTVQGLMMLGTMARPFLVCLHQIPQAVLSGLFFIMGISGLMGNVIVSRIIWLFTDSTRKNLSDPLNNIRTRSLVIFLCFSLAGFVGEFAITNTIAAIGFPLILLLTVIVCFIFPRIFTKEELEILDPHVAQRFTIKNLLMENLCGHHTKADDSQMGTIDF
ncbi:Bor1 protein [Maudiozyma humilis]|uniref:Bor1 protein n=1 Tax=Maudiozyma humilis TaxID=51915 RepID=A0AAV5RYN5_MAUHU|nr:Bor1 protein [Kazachstania humilis]